MYADDVQVYISFKQSDYDSALKDLRLYTIISP